MVTVRQAKSDADLDAWREVFAAVVPNERAPTVAQMRAQGSDRVRLLAEVDGIVVGSGIAGRSDLPDAAFVAPRILPEWRRRGIGTRVLAGLAPYLDGLGVSVAQASVDEAGSVAFAERFGFVEIDRQVEQVWAVAPVAAPRIPTGVEIVPVATRPALWREAYAVVGAQAFQDMALVAPIEVSLEQWEQEWISDPDAMFVALAEGEVIGCAGLIPDEDQPYRAENALTAVRRDWRGRGVAAALKRVTMAWAAEHGLREVYTWTQRGNADMRRLNEHLGYATRAESVMVRAPLPLRL